MPSIVVEPPTEEPLTVDDIKNDLRITHTDDDVLLARYIREAREFVEARVQLSMCTQTRQTSVDRFPSGDLWIPFGPVQSIDSITYDNEATTLAAASYELRDRVRVYAFDGWPTGDDITVEYVAGFGDADDVPGALKQAIRLKVQEFYDGVDLAGPINNLLMNYYTMAA